MYQRTELYLTWLLHCLNICIFMGGRLMQLPLRNYQWDSAAYIVFTTPLRRVVNIMSLLIYFILFTSRVLETALSVPTSKMACSVCPAVRKVCQGRTTRWCGNTQTRWKCASSATKTALRGKSIVLVHLRPGTTAPCVANICLWWCWCSNLMQSLNHSYGCVECIPS